MLENWFKPIKASLLENFKNFDANCFIKHISAYEKEIPDLKLANICLIGSSNTHHKIRQYLYGLNYNFNTIQFADLGNLLNHSEDFLIPVLKELKSNSIIPIILTEKPVLHAIQKISSDKQQRVAIIHRGNIDQKYLNNTFSTIAYQNQCINKHLKENIDQNHLDHIRLGKLRANFKEAEPVLRDCQQALFDVSAIQATDAPAQSNPWPTGLNAIEACQLSRYLGITDHIESICFSGFNLNNDPNDITAKTISQLIWFFIEGIDNRKNEKLTNEKMIHYNVNSEHFDFPLQFIKSEKSDRWWFKIPGKESGQDVFPCSYEDYERACQNNISDRILKALDTD